MNEQATEHLDLEKIIIISPAAGVVTYILVDAYRIIVVHEQRTSSKQSVAEPDVADQSRNKTGDARLHLIATSYTLGLLVISGRFRVLLSFIKFANRGERMPLNVEIATPTAKASKAAIRLCEDALHVQILSSECAARFSHKSQRF